MIFVIHMVELGTLPPGSLWQEFFEVYFIFDYVYGGGGMCAGAQAPEGATGIRPAWNWSYRCWRTGDGAQALRENSMCY